MKRLKENWLTEGLIDFEYKKYVLLAYLKEVKLFFQSHKLYPHLGDLVFHYQNLLSIKENKNLICENFPKVINEADFEKLKISYKRIVEDDKVVKEIEDIISLSIPQLKIVLDEGKDFYEYVENNVEIEPVGLSSLYKQEGYVFINETYRNEVDVYQYQISVFESANEKFRGIHLHFLENVRKGIGRTFENLKLELVKKYKQLPNPATYIVLTRYYFPLNETLLPVVKRLLVKYIYSGSV